MEADLGPPSEHGHSLRRVAAQEVHFSRAEMARVDTDHGLHGLGVEPPLVDARTYPADVYPGLLEGKLDELAHGVRFAGRDDVVVGLVLLEHEIHRFDVVPRVAPVAIGVDVAEVHALFLAL